MGHLELTGLCKSYGAIQIARNMNLSVPKGQALGIIGPNGAGKSSLFNLISGDAAPDSGVVRFDGKTITDLPSRVRASHGIGRTYQIPRPFSGMTVFENMLVSARFAGGLTMQTARQRCEEIVHQTGLAELIDAPAGSLRLLDRKRLELARALAAGPELLLLDEIAGGLTDAECGSLIDLIAAVNGTGVTVLWIEHVLHALVRVATRIIAVNAGEIIADGAPDDVMKSTAVREIYLGSAEAVS